MGQLFKKTGSIKILKYVWVVILFALLWGYYLYQAVGVTRPAFYTPDWKAQWIRYPGADFHRSYFRKELYLSDDPANAWIRISADNDYRLYVNNQTVGGELDLGSNTSPFQQGQSEAGQRIGDEIPFPIASPPEAQWRSSKGWTIATFYDIGPLLRKRKNVIAVAVQTDQKYAKFVLEGEMEGVSGERSMILSDDSWKASNLEEVKKGIYWIQSDFNAAHWLNAQPVAKPQEKIRVSIDSEMFRLPMGGEWICNTQVESYEHYFRKRFIIDSKVKDAWIRIAARGRYDLFINDTLIGSSTSRQYISMYGIVPLLKRGSNIIAVRTLSASRPIFPFRPTINPPKLLVDGRITKEDGSAITLVTDTSWETSQLIYQGWTKDAEGSGVWSQTLSTEKPSLNFLRSSIKKYRGAMFPTGDYNRGLFLYWSLSLGAVLLIWLAYSAYLSNRLKVGIIETSRASLLCYWPSIFLMTCLLLLRLRFAENPNKIFFHMTSFWQIAALISALIVVIVKIYILLFPKISADTPDAQTEPASLDLTNTSWLHNLWITIYNKRHFILLVLITLIGGYLRLKGLGFQGYHSDESSSLGAIIGIVKTGVPEYPSGVWYSRGPLFHYLVALFVKLFGTSRFASRLAPAIFGTLTIPLLYQFGKESLRNKKVALLAALLLALSPWAIFTSRSLRFYQQFQFFGLLTVFFFIKGFINSNNKKYQNYALVALACTALSQEVGVTILPALFLGYLFFAPKFSWRTQKNLIIGLFLVGIIVLADLLVFKLKCMTPFVGISATCASVMDIHLSNLPNLMTTLLVGYNRFHLIISFFFLFGVFICFRKKEKIVAFLYALVFTTVAVVTVAVMQVGLRYISTIYPFFLLLASNAVFEIIKGTSLFHSCVSPPAFVKKITPNLRKAIVTLVVCVLIFSYQPGRILDSYHSMINRGDTFAREFVKRHMNEDDVVIACHHPGEVAYIVGRCDYYIVQKGLFDEILKKDGVMIDRRGGAKIIDSPDKLRKVFNRNKRVWIIMSDLRLGAIQKDMLSFIRLNTKLVYQPFLSNVFLWEETNGIYRAPKHKGFERFYFD